jgi:hypothetical protein
VKALKGGRLDLDRLLYRLQRTEVTDRVEYPCHLNTKIGLPPTWGYPRRTIKVNAMHDTEIETVAKLSTSSPELCDRGLRILNEDSRPIVPPARRSEFIGERWIAGRACVVQPHVLSTTLLVNASFSELSCESTDRYSYGSSEEALLALQAWNGRLDPPGPWTKEEVTERVGPGFIDNSYPHR